MIVDDENIFRELLITTIGWENIGLQVCCEARNGMEALEQAKKIKPDIALIDINMPNMDGLTLSEKLMEKLPDIAIVLITGHSEFEYARKAVKLGVVDYILKPFNDEELIRILLKIKGSITKRKEEKDTIGNSKTYIKERLLNLLISSEYDKNDIETKKQMNYHGVKEYTNLFQVASIEIDNVYQKWSDAKEIILWKFAVSNILGEVINSYRNHFIFNGPEGRIISIVEVETGEGIKIAGEEGYQRLCRYVEKYLGFTVTVGLGKTHNDYKGIRNSYLESVAALQNKLLLGSNRVIDSSAIRNDVSNVGIYSSGVNEDILMSLRTRDWEKIKEKINEAFGYIVDNRLSTDFTYIICTGLISLCFSYIVETGNDIKELFGCNFLPFSEMRSKESIQVLHDWILEIFNTTVEYCKENKDTRLKKTAKAVREYINKHYGNNELCLDQIAGHFHINSDYLRSIFRKETDMTITEYITNVRMQKAREFLSSGNIKLSGISEMVGYNDAGYFSKCFKKFFGISPSEYEANRK